MKKKYRSNTKTIILYNFVGSVVIAVPLYLLGYYFEQLNFLIAVAFSLPLTSIIISIPTIYIIDNEILIIRQSFVKTKIDIKTIKRIKALVREHDIKIRYKKYKQVTIYPKDKYAFINDLKNINSDIEVIYK